MPRNSFWLFIVIISMSFGAWSSDQQSALMELINLRERIIINNTYKGCDSSVNQQFDSLFNKVNIFQQKYGYTNESLDMMRFYLDHLMIYDPEEALSLLKTMEQKAEELEMDSIKAYYRYNIGRIYQNYGLYNMALESYLISINFFQENGNKISYGYALVDLGNIFFHQDEYDEAKKYYMKSASVFELVRDSIHHFWGLALCYDNIGQSYTATSLLDSALYYYYKSIKYRFAGKISSTYHLGYMHLASTYAAMGRKDSADFFIQKAHNLVNIKKLDLEKIDVYLTQADYTIKSDTLSAIFLYYKAYQITTKMPVENQLNVISRLMKAYEGYNDDSAFYWAGELYEKSSSSMKFRKEALEYLITYFNIKENYKSANWYMQEMMEYQKKAEKNSIGKGLRNINEFFWKQEKKLAEMQKERDLLIQRVMGGFIAFAVIIMIILGYSRKKLLRYSKELNHSNEKLATSAKNLRQTIRHRDLVYSIIAHDLKGPLGTAMNFIPLLYKNMDDKKMLNSALPTIHNSLKSVYDLLLNLLSWTSIQRGKKIEKPEVLQLYDLVLDELNLLEPIAHNKNIKLEKRISKKDRIFADYKMMGIVIRNLVSNAIKFTSDGGKVIVTSQEMENLIRIKITDNGKGMTSETIQKVLESDIMESQLGTNNEKGSGLGIKVAKTFVEMNKGTFTIESKPDYGTTIIVELPKPG